MARDKRSKRQAGSQKDQVASPFPQATGISKTTCAVCVFLALALGLFVGSLLPPLLAPAPQPAAAPAPQPAAAPAPQAAAASAPQASAAPAPQAAAAPAPQPAAAPAPQAAAAAAVKAEMPPQLAVRVAELEQAVARDPRDARQWAELGNCYFDARQPTKAVAAYEHSLALAPDNADVLTDLGIMYRELGRYEEAVAHFRRASSVNPRHENALYNEGVVLYFDLRRNAEGMKAWQRLLAVNPAAHAPDGKRVTDMLRELR